jgi:hypothetical protein
MTLYVGTRNSPQCGEFQVVKVEDGKEQPLNPRLDLKNHSPTGFEVGYPGSGPAQLALAMCADALQDDRFALALYQDFKRKFIVKFPHEGFEMSDEAIRAWAEQHKSTLDLSDWQEEAERVADPSYTPTLAEALRHPDEFVAGMTETAGVGRAAERKPEALGIRANRDLVQKILAVGREFDVEKGGLFESGAGSVQIWCSPDDKPRGWDRPITRGAFPEPRELVGALSWEWTGDDEASLTVEAYPYELLPKGARGRDQWQQIPEETWQGCMVWLKEKAFQLVRFARMHETHLGAGCPFCDFLVPAGQMMNGLVSHVAQEHGGVKSVTLGEDFVFEMADGRRAKARNVTDISDARLG